MRAFLLMGLALWPLGALWAQNPEKKAEESAPPFAPLAYFDANCARCHGPNGSFYGANFGKTLKDDAALKQVVKDMCEGPGNAPLDAAKLEVLTDFHRALRDDKPFLVVVSQSAAGLSGEASPDAQITLESGAQSVAVEQKGNAWSVNFPVDFKKEGARLVARRGDKVSEIDVRS